jgi:ubiquitin carboxyl-terminal hydrolase 4/11/15
MSGYFQKNNETIQFPIDELDLSKHVTGPQEEAKYSLYGVCQHFGEYGGGHYVAKCKNGDSWYNYNDSSCHEANVNEIVNSSAYILFYRRKD